MHLTKNCLYFLNCRSVGIFKILSITKLVNIFESLTGISSQFHDSLLFSFYGRLFTEFRDTCNNIFIFINIVPDIDRVHFGKRKLRSMFIVFI